jgi:hypothetical protein
MSSKRRSKSRLQEEVQRPLQTIVYASSSSSSSQQPNCLGSLCFKKKKRVQKQEVLSASCDIFIYLKTSKGKWRKMSNCLTKDKLYSKVNNDRNSYINEISTVLPQSIYSNWVSNDKNIPLNNTGSNGNAGHKLFIKLPTYNIYITLNSYFKIQRSIDITDWYALPILNGVSIRIGNIYGIQNSKTLEGDKILQGEKPGTIIYKLYTKNEIERGIDEVIEEINEYDTPLITIRPALWDEQLYSLDNRKNWQTNEMILKLIKSILFVVPNSNTKCKFMTVEEWGNPFRQDLLNEDVTTRDLMNLYNGIYVELYKLFEILNKKVHIAMDKFIDITSFIYNYYGKANNVAVYIEPKDIKTLVVLATDIVLNNENMRNILRQDIDNNDIQVSEIYNKLSII